MPEPFDSLDLTKLPTYKAGVMKSKTFRSLNAHFAACLKPHGITAMQWYVIGTIYDAGEQGVGLSQLAHTVGSTLASLTEVVTILEAKGWVTKKDSVRDGRARVVSIVPARREDVQAIERNLREQLRTSIYSKITREELGVYLGVLSKLADL